MNAVIYDGYGNCIQQTHGSREEIKEAAEDIGAAGIWMYRQTEGGDILSAGSYIFDPRKAWFLVVSDDQLHHEFGCNKQARLEASA